MLEQILQDMYIDPELLEELDEEQKQVLFCKMREEQIRRYNEFEKEAEKEEKKNKKKQENNKKGLKSVDFLVGEDGNPWTWVMGEHPNDRDIDLILEEENLMKAKQLAEQEAEAERRKQEEAFRLEQERLLKEEEEKQAELRKLEDEVARKKSQEEREALERKLEEEKKAEQEKVHTLKLKREKKRKTSQIHVQEEKERRKSEIYQTFQDARTKLVAEAEASSNQLETAWVEQEKKAKELDNQRRVIARRAREEHRRSLMDTIRTDTQIVGMLSAGLKNIREANNNAATGDRPIVPPRRKNRKSRPSRPSDQRAVSDWIREVEAPRGAPYVPGTQDIAPWFHGIITRQEAENLLCDTPPGSFLIRVSEKVWGYAVSYRSDNRCKHFLVDASERGYQFFGTNQIIHNTLGDLVEFHKTKPISLMGRELLMQPVGQCQSTPDYQSLLNPDSAASLYSTRL